METGKLYSRPDDKVLRSGCLIICVILVTFTTMCSGLIGLGHFSQHPIVCIIAFVLASITAIPYMCFLRWVDRNEPEPWGLVFLSFFWGAFVATAISIIVNDGSTALILHYGGSLQTANFVKFSITAPLVEECSKGMALLAIFIIFRKEFDNLIDGVLYGAIIGLGFAWFENILYYMKPFMDQSASTGWADLLALFYARGLVSASGGTHAAYTALTGAAFGYFREKRKGTLRLFAIPFGLGMAIFAHFAWNTFYPSIAQLVSNNQIVSFWLGVPVSVLVLQIPFSLMLVLMVVFSWNSEIKIIWQYLKTESIEIITPDELARLIKRRKRKWDSFANVWQGMGFWWERHTLTQLQVKLAFSKWHHMHDEGITWPSHQDEEIEGFRNKIRNLRKKMRPKKNRMSKRRDTHL